MCVWFALCARTSCAGKLKSRKNIFRNWHIGFIVIGRIFLSVFFRWVNAIDCGECRSLEKFRMNHKHRSTARDIHNLEYVVTFTNSCTFIYGYETANRVFGWSMCVTSEPLCDAFELTMQRMLRSLRFCWGIHCAVTCCFGNQRRRYDLCSLSVCLQSATRHRARGECETHAIHSSPAVVRCDARTPHANSW